jgi:hypothetical protein
LPFLEGALPVTSAFPAVPPSGGRETVGVFVVELVAVVAVGLGGGDDTDTARA